MLEILNLSIKYNREILFIEYLKLNNGMFVIKGNSGSGKTSLFKCIDNKIFYDGWIKRNGSIGSYYHNSILNEEFSLSDLKRIDYNLNKKVYYSLLLKLDMENKESIKSKYLSKGEKQRAELIITLSLNKDVYLLDEPCSSLNNKYKRIVYSYLSKLGKEKLVIVNSHDDIKENFWLRMGRLISNDNKWDKMRQNEIICNKIKSDDNKWNIFILNGIFYNKLQTLVNIINISLSISLFYISCSLEKFLNNKIPSKYKGLIKNCFIKFDSIFYSIKCIVGIVFISSLIMYVLSIVNELLVNKEKINNLINYFSDKYIARSFIVRFLIEVIIVFVMSLLSILIIYNEMNSVII